MVPPISTHRWRTRTRSRAALRVAAVAAGCVVATLGSAARNADVPNSRYTAKRALNDTARITAAMARLDPEMAEQRLVCEPDPRGVRGTGEDYMWQVFAFGRNGRETQYFRWDMGTGRLLFTRRNGTLDDLIVEGKPVRVTPVGAVVAAQAWCRVLYGITDADEWRAVGAPRRALHVEYVGWRSRKERGVVGVNRSTGSLAWASLGADTINLKRDRRTPDVAPPALRTAG